VIRTPAAITILNCVSLTITHCAQVIAWPTSGNPYA